MRRGRVQTKLELAGRHPRHRTHHAPRLCRWDPLPPVCTGAELVPPLEALPQERVIVKKRFSAFFGTELHSVLGCAMQQLFCECCDGSC